MNSVKPLAIIAVLAAAGVGLYMKINSLPEPQPPRDFSGTWGSPPEIDIEGAELSGGGMPTGAPSLNPSIPGGVAPPYNPSTAEGTAPRYNPSAPAGTAPSFNLSPGGGTAPSYNHPSAGAGTPSRYHPSTGGGPAPSFHNPSAESETVSPFDPANRGTGSTDPRNTSPDPARSFPTTPGMPTANLYAISPSQDFAGQAAPGDSQSKTGLPSATFEVTWGQAERLLAAGQLPEAHLLLSRWYADPSLTEEEDRRLTNRLSELAGSVIYSKDLHLEAPYVVGAAGETLADIGQKYNVPAELLAKINGLTQPYSLQPGQELKVVRGPFMAVVNVSKQEMTLMLAGRYAGRFPIGVGADGQSAEGTYVVKNKLSNPTYYGRDRVIDADDPANPLGEHWLGLGKPLENQTAAPLGIHGTNDPAAVRRDDPRGYIRLAPQDADDAYGILSIGSKVIIRR